MWLVWFTIDQVDRLYSNNSPSHNLIINSLPLFGNQYIGWHRPRRNIRHWRFNPPPLILLLIELIHILLLLRNWMAHIYDITSALVLQLKSIHTIFYSATTYRMAFTKVNLSSNDILRFFKLLSFNSVQWYEAIPIFLCGHSQRIFVSSLLNDSGTFTSNSDNCQWFWNNDVQCLELVTENLVGIWKKPSDWKYCWFDVNLVHIISSLD